MSGEERDKKFEQALKLHLQAEAFAAAHASAEGVGDREGVAPGVGDVLRASACPDAEILSAFHERMLTDAEMNATKEHVAGCARCQEILSLLEVSDEVVLQDAKQGVTARESVLSTGALYEDLQGVEVPRMAAPAAVAAPSATREPQEISSGRGRSSRTWRWMVPAGAIAAGLFVWVAVHQPKYSSVTPSGNLQVAEQSSKDELAAQKMKTAPVPPSVALAPSDVSDYVRRAEPSEKKTGGANAGEGIPSLQQELRDGSDADGMTALSKAPSPELRRDTGAVNRPPAPGAVGASMGRAAKPAASPMPVPPPKSDAPGKETDTQKSERISNLDTVGRNTVSGGALAASDAAANRPAESVVKDAAKQKSGGAAEDTVDKNIGAHESVRVTAAAPSAAASAASSPRLPGAATPNQSAAKKEKAEADGSTSVAVGAAAQTVEVESTATSQNSKSMKKVKAGAGTLILTPDGTVRWRLGGGGKIERSTDSGTTWARQNTGSSRQLLAGAAPSAVVCWVVGRAGTILLTTDGGGHWNKVVSPIAGDIGRVAAADALHASVFRADSGAGVGAKFDSSKAGSFVTADGGVTWSPANE